MRLRKEIQALPRHDCLRQRSYLCGSSPSFPLSSSLLLCVPGGNAGLFSDLIPRFPRDGAACFPPPGPASGSALLVCRFSVHCQNEIAACLLLPIAGLRCNSFRFIVSNLCLVRAINPLR